ncbi:MBL fold metallo-hydrolase [Litorivicinus lipolyticus]|uniref:MBL fold metallo-hydrolase n=1 Tax=Litorivicinus lipolyticus TaxID=418701 RepID=A0A5Q2QAZ5_9GAMM|nr:MBL fold metallo-hydrolase [Litorivicinus lipolyticus]QGG79236.1 MBL fold metallo-hydrolase [Litorivicinus lipolyticus]
MSNHQIAFWGTRGSIPRSGKAFQRYGGATSCVELIGDGESLIFDAGSGIVEAGDAGLARGQRTFHVLLSHLHFDHIMGLPFFQPLWRADCEVHLYVGNLWPNRLVDALDDLMRAPFFPVTPGAFRCQLRTHDFEAGAALQVAGIDIQTLALTHPQGATGYRAQARGGDVCYITDIEPDAAMQARLQSFVRDAEVMLYDCTFDDDEFQPDHGHSTWQKCLAVAANAGVATPVIYHHHPRADDDAMDRIADAAMAINPNVCMARDGLRWTLESEQAARHAV